jgi:hypothetical protein
MQPPPQPPYGSPGAPAPGVFGAGAPYVSQLPVQPPPPKDSADLFVETLPSPTLRAAMVSAFATGMLLVLMGFRLVINVSGLVPAVIEGVMFLGAAAHFGVAWGLGNGRMAAAIGAFLLAPLVLLASGFTFFTGLTATAVTGNAVSLLSFLPAAAGGTLTVLECVLVAVSFGAIRRIARAKDELRRMAAT